MDIFPLPTTTFVKSTISEGELVRGSSPAIFSLTLSSVNKRKSVQLRERVHVSAGKLSAPDPRRADSPASTFYLLLFTSSLCYASVSQTVCRKVILRLSQGRSCGSYKTSQKYLEITLIIKHAFIVNIFAIK